MDFLKYILLFSAGTGAGFINMMAGGGAMLTIPVLIFMGLPSSVANGTNRLAAFIQCSYGSYSFYRKGLLDLKSGLILALPALAGCIIGSLIAVDLPDRLFNRALAIMMIIFLLIILFKPQNKIAAEGENMTLPRKIVTVILFFFIGLYGGIMQAGVGIIILATLSLVTGMKLVKINGLKLLVVAVYTISALLIFALNGKIMWFQGMVLACGNAFGSWLGIKFSLKMGEGPIKVILSCVVITMVVRLLFFT